MRCSAMLFSSTCATTGSTSSRCERRTSTRLGATPAAPALQKVVYQADGEPPDRQAAADLAGSRALPAEKKGARVRAPTAPRLPAERAHLGLSLVPRQSGTQSARARAARRSAPKEHCKVVRLDLGRAPPHRAANQGVYASVGSDSSEHDAASSEQAGSIRRIYCRPDN